jgi:hypothetical protein
MKQREYEDRFECPPSTKQLYRHKMVDYLLTGNPIRLHEVAVFLMANDELKKRLKTELGDKFDTYNALFQAYVNVYQSYDMISKDLKGEKDEKKVKILIAERDKRMVQAPIIHISIIVMFQKLLSYTDLVNIPIQSPNVKHPNRNTMPVDFVDEREFRGGNMEEF